MFYQILVIDNDVSTFERQQQTWEQHGFSLVGVETMDEAILSLCNDQYAFVGINGDNINYNPSLKTLRELTVSPILIGTSHYTAQEQIAALMHGADLYAPFHASFEDNVLASLMILKKCNEQKTPLPKRLNTIACGRMILFPASRKVYYKNRDVHLTKLEFDLLYFFVNNPACVYTYEEIFSHVWRMSYDERSKALIWTQIRRLRAKLATHLGLEDCIRAIREVGYSFALSDSL